MSVPPLKWCWWQQSALAYPACNRSISFSNNLRPVRTKRQSSTAQNGRLPTFVRGAHQSGVDFGFAVKLNNRQSIAVRQLRRHKRQRVLVEMLKQVNE